jgi:hypothetical protein
MNTTVEIKLPKHYNPSDCVRNNLPHDARTYWASHCNKKYSYRGVPIYISCYVGKENKVGFWHPLTGEEIDVARDFSFEDLPKLLDEKLDHILGKGMIINWTVL